MAEERDLTHDPISGQGMHAGDMPPPLHAYPGEEADYWRSAYGQEPYFEEGRAYEDYAAAYELGWTSQAAYGGEFDIADRLIANDWPLRKGVSTLSWDQARPASRAAWQRAHNRSAYTTDESASAGQVIDTLNDLLENARDGELGFREAAEHTKTPHLARLFGRRADTCRQAVTELHAEILKRGGKPDDGGSVTGAAHRVWLHIRGLFGGASDETMLTECERGEDAALARYRKALGQNLPAELHALVLRQFEGAQRNHDMIRLLRDRAKAETQAKTDSPA
jgi:uncharacterized protein (TIGR02284 family)